MRIFIEIRISRPQTLNDIRPFNIQTSGSRVAECESRVISNAEMMGHMRPNVTDTRNPCACMYRLIVGPCYETSGPQASGLKGMLGRSSHTMYTGLGHVILRNTDEGLERSPCGAKTEPGASQLPITSSRGCYRGERKRREALRALRVVERGGIHTFVPYWMSTCALPSSSRCSTRVSCGTNRQRANERRIVREEHPKVLLRPGHVAIWSDSQSWSPLGSH